MAQAAQPGCWANNTSMGKISKRPTSISKLKHQLDQRRKIRKADHRADQFQTGADVVQAGCHRSGQKVTRSNWLDGHHHGGQHKNDQVEVHVGAHAKHRLSSRGLPSNRTVVTAWGCSTRIKSCLAVLHIIMIRLILMPPPVEPAKSDQRT